MSLKFTPPVAADKYALAIGSFFRTYKELGTAKIAYHTYWRNGSTAYILERVGNDWYVLYTVPGGRVEYKDLPWTKKFQSYSYTYGGYNPERYHAVPMTREEYAEWRLKVEFERMSEMDDEELADHIEEMYSGIVTEEENVPEPARPRAYLSL